MLDPQSFVLALNTVGETTSVAALNLDGRVLASRVRAERMGQSEFILPLIDEVCEAAGVVARKNLACLAVATGPGSFTGVRVGLAAAQGLARALGVRLVGVDRFTAIEGFLSEHKSSRQIGVVLNSFREELYVSLTGVQSMLLPDEILAQLTGHEWAFAGDGVALLDLSACPQVEVVELPVCEAVLTGLQAVKLLALGLPLPPALPHYCREPDITLPKPMAQTGVS